MDYSEYSMDLNFNNLYDKFDLIVGVLSNKLLQFASQGFQLNNFRLIGFSFGASVSLRTGEKLGPNALGNIDGMRHWH